MPLEKGPVFTASRLDGGLVTRFPAHELRDSQSPDAQNFDPSEVGANKKRKGYIKFTSAAKTSPTGTFVSGLYAAAVSGGTPYVLASEGTTLHDITAGNWSTTISGATITVDTPVRMFMFNDLFIICNQGGGPYKWTGSGATASLGGSPPSNARGGGVHRSRTWLYTADSSLTHSALANPEDYSTTDNAGTFTVNKGDGYIINGFCSGGDFAVISKIAPSSGGKEGALYGLFGGTPFDYTVKKIANVGAFSQEAMLQYNNLVVVATNQGIFAINGRNLARVDDPVFPTYDEIPNKGTIVLGRYGKTIRVAYPASGSTNNRELIWDVERGVWGRNTGKTVRRYTNHPDGRLLFGTSSTSILVWEDENGSNDDGADINWYWESPDMTFGDVNSLKRLSGVYPHVSNSVTTTITLEHYINGTAQSLNQSVSTSSDSPVAHFVAGPTAGVKHRIRLTDNSSNGQVKIFGLTAFAEKLQLVQ